MAALHTPLPLPWSTLTSSSPSSSANQTLASKFLVPSPRNPHNCTCGRYTFLRKCSCIHATVSRPCGRTRTTARTASGGSVPTFCTANPPHHYVVDFVVGDECEDHPGYKLRPWPYTTTTKRNNATATTTARPAGISSQRIIPTPGCGMNMAASSSVGGQVAPMAKV